MIERVEQYGAFIHIGDHIALPHARPEDGVKRSRDVFAETSTTCGSA